MTTSPLSPVLPASPHSAGVQRNGDSPEFQQAAAGSFSSVLARQNGNSPSTPAPGMATPGASTPGTSTPGTSTPGASTPGAAMPGSAKPGPTENGGTKGGKAAQHVTDEEALAQAAADQGLSLPQLALNIAAEVAAVQRSASPDGGLGISRLQNDSTQFARDTTGLRQSRAALGLTSASARAAATSAAAAEAGANARQNPGLPSGLVPAQVSGGAESVANPAALAGGNGGLAQGSTIASGRAASIAGAKQAVLAMQARAQAAGAAHAGTDLPEFITLANGAAVAGSTATQVKAGLISAAADAQFGQLDALAGATGTAHANQPSNLGGFSLLMGASGQAASSVATPLSSPQWASDFGRQFVSMAQGGHNMPHTAELRLDPPELGPLRISLNVIDNVAHAVFVSAHASVRQTLENSLPQLQQLLAQAGISLGQTSVSDQGQPQQAFGDGGGSNHGRQTAQAGMAGTSGADTSASTLRSGSRSPAPDALVDTFA